MVFKAEEGIRDSGVTGVQTCELFFFQAEDGIRDWSVTGVQTCALPIWCVVCGVWCVVCGVYVCLLLSAFSCGSTY